ncbi:MAG: acyl carrier protein [Lachnospiraceae bacterium]|nr:acyl carrier protein [Lachnospiraceae bacterium]MDY5741503.1 acyl carrier protein [Lachnospiraceae bacterium]
MRDTILGIVDEIRPDIDFETETALVDDGVLDSLDIVAIVAALQDEFDVEIRAKDLIPENFNSVDAMEKLITRLEEE